MRVSKALIVTACVAATIAPATSLALDGQQGAKRGPQDAGSWPEAPSRADAEPRELAPPPTSQETKTGAPGEAAQATTAEDAQCDELADVAYVPGFELVPAIESRTGGSNYFAVGLYDDGPGWCPKEGSCIVKFRIDLEFDVVRIGAYPQTGFWSLTLPVRLLSFWDLFNRQPGADSRPFIETNYAPGAEIAWLAPQWINDELRMRAGWRHESNGLGTAIGAPDNLARSRSWDRGYFDLDLVAWHPGALKLTLGASSWIPFNSDPVPEWNNERIEDQVGWWEGRVGLHWVLPNFGLHLNGTGRRHSLQGELRVSLRPIREAFGGDNAVRFDVFSQCFYGRGERLIVANEKRFACYVGLGL